MNFSEIIFLPQKGITQKNKKNPCVGMSDRLGIQSIAFGFTRVIALSWHMINLRVCE